MAWGALILSVIGIAITAVDVFTPTGDEEPGLLELEELRVADADDLHVSDRLRLFLRLRGSWTDDGDVHGQGVSYDVRHAYALELTIRQRGSGGEVLAEWTDTIDLSASAGSASDAGARVDGAAFSLPVRVDLLAIEEGQAELEVDGRIVATRSVEQSLGERGGRTSDHTSTYGAVGYRLDGGTYRRRDTIARLTRSSTAATERRIEVKNPVHAWVELEDQVVAHGAYATARLVLENRAQGPLEHRGARLGPARGGPGTVPGRGSVEPNREELVRHHLAHEGPHAAPLDPDAIDLGPAEIEGLHIPLATDPERVWWYRDD